MGSITLFLATVSLVVATFQVAHGECNGPNEVRKCLKDCPPPRTCKNLNIQYRCAEDSEDNKKCTTKCVCKPGFYRQSYDGSCITKEQCGMCKGPNEFYSCGSACDNECATLGQRCPIVNIKCNERCYCKAGYARNDKKICVPESQCKKKCPQNEEYRNCLSCPPDTCRAMLEDHRCDPRPPCKPGCQCKRGYWRHNNKCMQRCPQLN